MPASKADLWRTVGEWAEPGLVWGIVIGGLVLISVIGWTIYQLARERPVDRVALTPDPDAPRGAVARYLEAVAPLIEDDDDPPDHPGGPGHNQALEP